MKAIVKDGSFVIDLEKLNTLNAEGCPACGQKFNLGDVAVMACGAWSGPPKPIHKDEGVFDRQTHTYVERKCYAARKDATALKIE